MREGGRDRSKRGQERRYERGKRGVGGVRDGTVMLPERGQRGADCHAAREGAEKGQPVCVILPEREPACVCHTVRKGVRASQLLASSPPSPRGAPCRAARG